MKQFGFDADEENLFKKALKYTSPFGVQQAAQDTGIDNWTVIDVIMGLKQKGILQSPPSVNNDLLPQTWELTDKGKAVAKHNAKWGNKNLQWYLPDFDKTTDDGKRTVLYAEPRQNGGTTLYLQSRSPKTLIHAVNTDQSFEEVQEDFANQ